MNNKSKQILNSINLKYISQSFKSKMLTNRKSSKHAPPKNIVIKDKNKSMNNQINLEFTTLP